MSAASQERSGTMVSSSQSLIPGLSDTKSVHRTVSSLQQQLIKGVKVLQDNMAKETNRLATLSSFITAPSPSAGLRRNVSAPVVPSTAINLSFSYPSSSLGRAFPKPSPQPPPRSSILKRPNDCLSVEKISSRLRPTSELEKDLGILKKTSSDSGTSSAAGELIARYQLKVRENKRALSRLRLEKDAQLEAIRTQLFIMEVQLRKEQKEILARLEQRDSTIASQQQEITKLRRDNRRLIGRLKKLTSCEALDTNNFIHHQLSSASSLTSLSSSGRHYHHQPVSAEDTSDSSIYDSSISGSFPRNKRSESTLSLPDTVGYGAPHIHNHHQHHSHRHSTASKQKPNSADSDNATNANNFETTNPNLSVRVKANFVLPQPKTVVNKNISSATLIYPDNSPKFYLKGKSVCESINANVASVRAVTEKIAHKPPIAEKPKVCTAGRVQTATRSIPPSPVAGPPHSNSTSSKNSQSASSKYSKNFRQCTIVSTISRLLEEQEDESDCTGGPAGSSTALESSSSEPSSPEATLKPQTPRVIRLARQYESNGITDEDGTLDVRASDKHKLMKKRQNSATDSSPESLRSHQRIIKSLLMDECEATSGYNSDAVSDHDYENVHLMSTTEERPTTHCLTISSQDGSELKQNEKEQIQEDDEEGYVEEDDNYVILQAAESDVKEVPEMHDLPIYSNVHFNSDNGSEQDKAVTGRRQKMPVPSNVELNLTSVARTRSLDDLLETNLDSPTLGGYLDGKQSDSTPSTPIKNCSALHSVMSVPNLAALRRSNLRQFIRETLPLEHSQPHHIADNFEEFRLDSLELEGDHDSSNRAAVANVNSVNRMAKTYNKMSNSWIASGSNGNHLGKENLLPAYELRRCGDGAEMKKSELPTALNNGITVSDSYLLSSTTATSLMITNGSSSSLVPCLANSGHSYEKFLEATGLSQKSILTPSRMFSNHRSVLKPRDVKHRDKLRAFTTLATLEEAPSPTPC